jgi:hypothetical protein
MSEQWNLLSERNFFQFIQTIYDNVSEMKCLSNNIQYDLNKKQQLIKEIFIRLPSLDSNSINLCLKTFALLIQQSNEIDVRNILIYKYSKTSISEHLLIMNAFEKSEK